MKQMALALLLGANLIPSLQAQSSVHLNVPVTQHVTVAFSTQPGLPSAGAITVTSATFADGTKWDLTQGLPAGYALVLMDVQITAYRPSGESRAEERLVMLTSATYDRSSGYFTPLRSHHGVIQANRWVASFEMHQTAGQSYSGQQVPLIYSNYLEPDETAAPITAYASGYIVRLPRIVTR